MNRYKKILVAAAVLLAGLALQAQDLVILHTNDTHSQIEPERVGPGAGLGGVHRRAVYIEQVRAEHKNVLLLDAGDFNQGTPYYTVNKGAMEIDLMNAMGYEVACLGNHEFDNGQEDLAKRLAKAKFEIVCANYDFSKTPLAPYVKPYTILEKAGKKIGIFGLLVKLNSYVSGKSLKNMEYQDAIAVADRMADLLKNEKKCDMVIALTHIGYEMGEDADDIKLAQATDNIDLIIGGHSHTFLKESKLFKNKAGKNVVVVQTGAKGDYVGRFDITF